MSGAVRDLEIIGPQDIIAVDQKNSGRLSFFGKTSLVLNTMIAIVMVVNFCEELAIVFPDASFTKVLKLMRIIRLLPVLDIFVVSGALCAIRSMTAVPRSLECRTGLPCLPWTFMILGTLSGVDVFWHILSQVRNPASGHGIVVVVVLAIRAIDAVLLLVLGKVWLRRIKDEGISYAAMG